MQTTTSGSSKRFATIWDLRLTTQPGRATLVALHAVKDGVRSLEGAETGGVPGSPVDPWGSSEPVPCRPQDRDAVGGGRAHQQHPDTGRSSSLPRIRDSR